MIDKIKKDRTRIDSADEEKMAELIDESIIGGDLDEM